MKLGSGCDGVYDRDCSKGKYGFIACGPSNAFATAVYSCVYAKGKGGSARTTWTSATL